MTTERTDKSLTLVRLLFASGFLTQIDAEPHKPLAIKPEPIEQNKEAACEWTFDREITKECEMTAATLVNRQAMPNPSKRSRTDASPLVVVNSCQ